MYIAWWVIIFFAVEVFSVIGFWLTGGPFGSAHEMFYGVEQPNWAKFLNWFFISVAIACVIFTIIAFCLSLQQARMLS